MLNRFWKAKADEARGETAERPNVASTVQSITLAEKWRTQIVREMSRKVAEIQNGLIFCFRCFFFDFCYQVCSASIAFAISTTK